MAGQGKPGRPKKTVEDPENASLFPENLPEDLAEVFDALPGEDKVISLFRIQSSGPPAFLISLSPEGLRNLSTIQEEFGGGKYKAVAKNYETGEKVERSFTIEGDPKVKGEQLLVHDPKTGFFLPKSQWKKELGYEGEKEKENATSDPILRLYERQLDRMEAEIAQLKEAKSGNGMSEMFQLLIQAKELIAPQVPVNQGSVDAQTIFNAMSKGMEMITNRDNENNQPAFVTVAREILPIIQQMLNRVITPKPGQPGQPGQPVPPPGLQADLSAKDVTPATGFQALIPMLEPYKQTFIDAASNDDNPELLIPLVARRVPPDKKDEIIKWIQEGKWFPDLVSLDQRISFQRAWWEEFCKGLLRELTGEVIKEHEEVASE